MDINIEELIALLQLAIETGDFSYVQDALDLINESDN